MASLFDRYDLVSRLFFVFQSIGSIFLEIPVFTIAIKRFVLGKGNSAESNLQLLPNGSFVAECEGVAYLKGSVISEKILFQELHDISLELGQPLGTVLVSSQETCRICCNTLVLEKKVHPVVIYRSYRGTYLGSRVTKVCRRCKLCEHYGYWSHGRKKTLYKREPSVGFPIINRGYYLRICPLAAICPVTGFGGFTFQHFRGIIQ